KSYSRMRDFKPVEHGPQFIPQSLSHVGARRRLESQTLRISIQRHLLLRHFAQRLDPWEETAARIPQDRVEPSKPLNIALKQIQQVCLDNIVQVVSRRNLCRSDPLGPDVDRLSSEDATIRTRRHTFWSSSEKIVQTITVQFLERYDLVIDVELVTVFFCQLYRLLPVPSNAFMYSN